MEEISAISHANAVAIKLPTFWTSQPRVWFVQTEAQFHLRGIVSDTTKYYYVVGALDQETAGRMIDTLSKPPLEGKYENLKSKLLSVFGLTRRDRACKLLDMTGLGDRKPSALLSEMSSLANGHTSCMLFEEIFLRQMPEAIRMQLAGQDFTNLDLVSERADELWQSMNSRRCESEINKVGQSKSTSNRPVSVSHTDSENKEGWCFYHTRFGTKSYKCREPCSFANSTSKSAKIATVLARIGTQPLLFVWDRISGRRFLVDTGAEVSVIPATHRDRQAGNHGPSLVAANDTPMRTYGRITIPLNFNSRCFHWSFTTADVPQPLLGADFLRSNNLLVDLKRKKLVDAESYLSISCGQTTGHTSKLASVAKSDDRFNNLLSEFPNLSVPTFSQTTTKHGVEQNIATKGPPVHGRPRRLSPKKLAFAKLEFQKMLEMGIIRRSNSPWASSLHMVPKHSENWRPVGDYRRLNEATIPDRYPLVFVRRDKNHQPPKRGRPPKSSVVGELCSGHADRSITITHL
ncbi:Retrovirus-related Pol polyprotein from transposon opus [Thelohanellus kitauei]|uniref:Retrovirus-related Pol polyprotein from transposon opus n=1 Tax=Thelohanellus kitauei TaxID=669202 RepID=A0A0C2J3Z4_THEKT|nr:Retrovirus-related Pol polyprotein from transposon opus [Thelohanellus kitauei]